VQGAVAKRYAMALFEIGQSQGKLELLDGQAKQLAQVFGDKRVLQFATHPRIPVEQKKAVLATRLGGGFDPVLLNLLRLLIDKKRIGLLLQILRWFDQMTDEASGVEGVTIVSAVPLSDEQCREILTGIKRFSAYGDLRVETKVDPSLLGGVEVRLGDNLVLDGSVASRLKALRDRLVKYRHRGLGA